MNRLSVSLCVTDSASSIYLCTSATILVSEHLEMFVTGKSIDWYLLRPDSRSLSLPIEHISRFWNQLSSAHFLLPSFRGPARDARCVWSILAEFGEENRPSCRPSVWGSEIRPLPTLLCRDSTDVRKNRHKRCQNIRHEFGGLGPNLRRDSLDTEKQKR